ncbi:MAG: hypothetical protein ACKVOW_12585 [Chitinophagaceae bacterium]
MKKILSTRLSLLLFIILFVTNCRKETRAPGTLDEVFRQQQKDNKHEKGNDCRLTIYDYYDAINDFSQIDQYSYKNGLVDEWLPFYGILYKIEYDNKKKLKTARAYDGATLMNTIQFIYQKNKVIKEIWYAGNTNQVDDEVNYVFNQKGQMIYNESISFGYSVTYTYYENGNLKSWFYYEGGLPNSKAEYTYRNKFNNPFNARPGIFYSFAWANAAFGTGENWYSSEKITLYDELGNPSVYYDQNPKKTVWQVGEKKYPLKATYVDALSGGIITNSFEYENCSEKDNYSPTNIISQKPGMNNILVSDEKFKLMRQGPQTGMIKKLKELGKRLKK